MSLKRDDLGLLKKLKRQRVSELLGTYIPEDEAKLLSNGSLTCTICLHRPVFDTIAALSSHREGIKHLLELSRYMLRKLELSCETLEKQRLDAVEALNVQMSVKSSICSGALGGRKYRPDSARRKKLGLLKFNQEKPLIPFSKHESFRKQSSASQVRRYLSTLHRKRSLESLVEWKRRNYGEQARTQQNVTVTETKENVEPLKKIVIK